MKHDNCPNCGGEAAILCVSKDGRYVGTPGARLNGVKLSRRIVMCSKCGLQTKPFRSAHKAMKKWKTGRELYCIGYRPYPEHQTGVGQVTSEAVTDTSVDGYMLVKIPRTNPPMYGVKNRGTGQIEFLLTETDVLNIITRQVLTQ